MTVDLEKFKIAYKKWVEESLPDYRAGKMQEIVKKYPFVVSDGVPWTPYRGHPSQQSIAMVTSGGLYIKNSQPAFHTESIHGDPDYRKIPKTARQEDFGIAHPHYDNSLAEQDINVIFPIQRLLELEKEGIIGRVADTHYSFGYVNDIEALVTRTAPEVIEQTKADGVDILFLVPV